MKLNIFKIDNSKIEDLINLLKSKGYNEEGNIAKDGISYILYLYKKEAKRKSWVDFYSSVLATEKLSMFQQQLDADNLSGSLIIKTTTSIFAVSHGNAHFILRMFCDKDFGLNLAERIAQPDGLTLKHSQTFTSLGKKDITSYNKKRKLNESIDYGEAFNYVKCKTSDNSKWGETADFGESARFSPSKKFPLKFDDINKLIKNIEDELSKRPQITIPRYQQVNNKEIIDKLNKNLTQHFFEYLEDVITDEYWLTGVTFNFASDQRCSVRYLRKELVPLSDSLDSQTVKEAVTKNKDKIKDYNLIRVIFYDENDQVLSSDPLKNLMLVTIEQDGKYYVSHEGSWFVFSESYIKFIEQQVDEITFEKKNHFGLGENELIDKLVAEEGYTKLHKDNVHIGKYCIEKADLMDEENVIMIKDQNTTSDLVYLVKQATTSIRLSESGDLQGQKFSGKNICLWMLLNRQTLSKISDLKSFHLLDAINDFKKEVQSKNLTPVIWISLKNE